MLRAEIEAIEAAHRAAQARLGIAGAYLALLAWNSVSAVNAAATAANWTAQLIRMVIALRRRSRKLAQAYYQLSRALQTGYTLGQPPEGVEATLAGLRRNFLEQLNEVATMEGDADPTGDADLDWFDSELRAAGTNAPRNARQAGLAGIDLDKYIQDWLDAADDADAEVDVDDYAWPTDTSDEAIEDYMRRRLADFIKDRDDAIREARQAEEAEFEATLRALEEEHERAGNDAAGTVHKTALDAGRRALDTAMRRDRRIRSVARGLGPNPCAFCAMLASRGFVYMSGASASGTTARISQNDNEVGPVDRDGNDRYSGAGIRIFHDNCNCYPIYRWVDETEMPLPERNAYFQEMWPVVTDGETGVDALNAWRRWLYAQRKEAARSEAVG